MKILLIGNGAREHALAEALARSRHRPAIVVIGDRINPGICALAADYRVVASLADVATLAALAAEFAPDYAVVGPEAPLCAGVVDALAAHGIPSFGPTQACAKLEGSKGYTRRLQQEYDVPGAPEFIVFQHAAGEEVPAHLFQEIRSTLASFGEFVVKADGLRGGKGVLLSGEHLRGADDGAHFAAKCLQEDGRVVIEEKLVGEEFSLMFITDGTTLVACPAVQDHKRAFAGDTGPNTGGMGTYSDVGGTLPFLASEDYALAREITAQMLRAVNDETGEVFRGVLYGGFMATRDGVRLIEYNTRFGDPEAMNILPLLQTDFVDLIIAVTQGTLASLSVHFAPSATVVKYLVPQGYPTEPLAGQAITVGDLPRGAHAYYAAVDLAPDGSIVTSHSRAVAVLGVADTLAAAADLAEVATQAIGGALTHRADIGTPSLVQKRIDHMQTLRG